MKRDIVQEIQLNKKMKMHNSSPKESYLYAQARSAALKGSLLEMSSLLQQGFDINTLDLEGNTVLHLATSQGHIALISFLLKRSMMLLNQRNHQGQRPLDIAIEKDQFEAIAFLIEKGSKPTIDFFFKVIDLKKPTIELFNAIDRKRIDHLEITALLASFVLGIALEKEYLGVIDLYIKEGFYNFTEELPCGDTPLEWALSYHYTKFLAIKLLEEIKFSPDFLTQHLPSALWHNDITLIDMFLSKGATFGWDPDKTFYNAIEHDADNTMKYLIEKGAEVTPLMVYHAVRANSIKTLKVLLDKNNDFGFINTQIPIPLLILAYDQKQKELIQTLVEYGYTFECNQTLLAEGENTIYQKLINAILTNNTYEVSLLLSQTRERFLFNLPITPLKLACLLGYKEIILLLLKPNPQSHFGFGIEETIMGNNEDSFELVLKDFIKRRIFVYPLNLLTHAIKARNTTIINRCLEFLKDNQQSKNDFFSSDVININSCFEQIFLMKAWPLCLKLVDMGFYPFHKEPISSDIDFICANKLIEKGCRIACTTTPENGLLSQSAHESEAKKYLKSKDKSNLNLANISMKYHQSPCIWAAMFGHEEPLKKALVKKQYELLDHKDFWLRTPLIYSIIRSNPKITELLLKDESGYNPYNIDVNHRDIFNNTALLYAIHYAKRDTIVLLLNAGAQVTAKALYTALKKKDYVLTFQLLLLGCKTFGNFFSIQCNSKPEGVCSNEDCLCNVDLPRIM